ncbi:MAG: hypothetical protein MJ179_05665 [Treponema sp.]|nr:hypothetical protein [Treponema sp.]
MKKLIMISLALIFTLSPLSAQVSPMEPEVVAAFGQNLYENGFIDEAESEFKRYLFLEPVDESSFSEQQEQIIFNLTAIYNTQNNKSGITWLEDNFSKGLSLDIKEKMDFVNAKLLFKERDQQQFESFINNIEEDLENYQPSFQLLTSISKDLFLYNIEDARDKANTALKDYQQFEQFAKACAAYNTKSAALATTLSVLIPGAGKWYTGNFLSFLSSFASIGAFTAAAVYTGIQHDWKNWRPYVYGTCALGLYIADIYGSYQAAKRYNAAQYNNLCTSLDYVYEQSF